MLVLKIIESLINTLNIFEAIAIIPHVYFTGDLYGIEHSRPIAQNEVKPTILILKSPTTPSPLLLL